MKCKKKNTLNFPTLHFLLLLLLLLIFVKVAKALGMSEEERKAKDDGEFWLTVEDFVAFFDGVDILDRDVDVDTIVIEIDEDDGRCLGPLKGCAKGCFSYYCLCEGARLLCCPHRGSDKTTKVKKCCGVVVS